MSLFTSWSPLSPKTARDLLREIQQIADSEARTDADLDNGMRARQILARLIGRLEAHLPRDEWNQVDVFRTPPLILNPESTQERRVFDCRSCGSPAQGNVPSPGHDRRCRYWAAERSACPECQRPAFRCSYGKDRRPRYECDGCQRRWLGVVGQW